MPVIARPPPCTLPELPGPLAPAIGYPDPEHVLVTKEDWAQLGGYLAGVRAWIVVAASCIEAR